MICWWWCKPYDDVLDLDGDSDILMTCSVWKTLFDDEDIRCALWWWTSRLNILDDDDAYLMHTTWYNCWWCWYNMSSWPATEQIDMMSMVCLIVTPLEKNMMTMWLDDLAVLKSRCWWTKKIEKCVATVLLRVMIRWSAVLTNNITDWKNRWCWCDSEL